MQNQSKTYLSAVIAASLLLISSCSGVANRPLDRASATRVLDEYFSTDDADKIRVLFSEGATDARIAIEDKADVALLDSELAHVKQVPLLGYATRVCLFLTDKGKARSKDWIEMKELEELQTPTEDCPYSKSWLIPIGSLDDFEVTGIQTPSETSASVEFDVRYSPNKVGKLLIKEGLNAPFEGPSPSIDFWEESVSRTADLELYDDGWRIVDTGW